MKATLATLACLLTAGLLTAASVDGNNTAVVIRKDVVKSDTGYQFLCVPVNGLDIANGATSTIKLSTFLPASNYPNGTTVMGTNGNTLASVSNGEWDNDSDLEGGTIFWLKVETVSPASLSLRSSAVTTYAEDAGTGTTKDEPIVFCGQDRTRTAPTAASGMTAQKNDSSVALTLGAIVSNPGAGDRILVLKNGSSDYAQYKYDGSKWWGPGFKNDCTDKAVIAPGEAVYYFKK